jgi:hypothetical protein
MIAIGSTDDGARIVILSDAATAPIAGMFRLELTDELASDVVSQIVNLLEARAARKGTPAPVHVAGARPMALVTADVGDPAEEARQRDAAELERRKQEESRDTRRARAGRFGQ